MAASAPSSRPTGPVGPFYPLGRNPRSATRCTSGFKPNPNNPTPFPRKMRFLALRPAASDRRRAAAGRASSDATWCRRSIWSGSTGPRPIRTSGSGSNVLADESVAFTRDGYIDVEGPQRDRAVGRCRREGADRAEPRYWLRVRLIKNNYPAGRAPRLEHFLPELRRRRQPADREPAGADRPEQRQREPDASTCRSGRSSRVRSGSRVRPATRPRDGLGRRSTTSSPRRATTGTTRLDAAAGPHHVRRRRARRDPAVRARHRRGDVAARRRRGRRTTSRPGAIKTIVDQTPGIEKVTNVRRPAGGADEETLEQFRRRAPGELRRSGRAITEEDFATIAKTIDGVQGRRGARRPPSRLSRRHGARRGHGPGRRRFRSMPPRPSAELLRSICRALDGVRLITTGGPRGRADVRRDARRSAPVRGAGCRVRSGGAGCAAKLDDLPEPVHAQVRRERVAGRALLAALREPRHRFARSKTCWSTSTVD